MKLGLRAQILNSRDENLRIFWGPATGWRDSARAVHDRDMRVLALALGKPPIDVYKGGPIDRGEIEQAEAWAAEQ